ncbi:MAG: glycosyltransferase [Haloquadratum sp.]|jgi:glycosyltransferase involved in cell wall biosynthesis|nr:glycosyltransferase [Haloferacaceae archaeon]MDR9444777.1 glycosyltransferase [Haloquadratum sp.]
MSLPTVGVFTDTYLPTVNGVSYTVALWRDRYVRRGGTQWLVYPDHPDRAAADGERPVRSVPLPIYPDFRVAPPMLPDGIGALDLVHVHSPFGMGLAGRRAARDVPLVVSYHTPTPAYAAYVPGGATVERAVAALASRYERWFLQQADLVVFPSAVTRDASPAVGEEQPPTAVVSNGVDLDRFAPAAPSPTVASAVSAERPTIGYTGRLGQEKQLDELLLAAAELDVQVLVGGDGPARADLEGIARQRGVDATFLGFLPREELPGFYSALDLFVFPSPVETQGIVAMEAIACGTPVIAADAAALSETVTDGVDGLHYPPRDIDALRAAIARGLRSQGTLEAGCHRQRDALGVSASIDALIGHYRALC